MADSADVIVIGAGIGGLTTSALLQERGLSTITFEKNPFPGGSCSSFKRGGYTFDAGASVFYGFAPDDSEGTLNLHTKIFNRLGIEVNTIPDPVQIHYHLPLNFDIPVHYERSRFLEKLSRRFPHEAEGIRSFYRELEDVYIILNSLPAGSLENPAHLVSVGLSHPLKTFALAFKTFRPMGNVARKYIKDEELLHFIDLESYSWAVQDASSTPLVNAESAWQTVITEVSTIRWAGQGVIPAALVKGIEKFGGEVPLQQRGDGNPSGKWRRHWSETQER